MSATNYREIVVVIEIHDHRCDCPGCPACIVSPLAGTCNATLNRDCKCEYGDNLEELRGKELCGGCRRQAKYGKEKDKP